MCDGDDSNNENVSSISPVLTTQKFLTNQISVHTFFQRYTISGTEKSPFVHGEYSARCLARYRWKMLDIYTLIILSNGNWYHDEGDYHPELHLKQLLEGTHPKNHTL